MTLVDEWLEGGDLGTGRSDLRLTGSCCDREGQSTGGLSG